MSGSCFVNSIEKIPNNDTLGRIIHNNERDGFHSIQEDGRHKMVIHSGRTHRRNNGPRGVGDDRIPSALRLRAGCEGFCHQGERAVNTDGHRLGIRNYEQLPEILRHPRYGLCPIMSVRVRGRNRRRADRLSLERHEYQLFGRKAGLRKTETQPR